MMRRERRFVFYNDMRDWAMYFRLRDAEAQGRDAKVEMWKESWADAPMFNEAARELETKLGNESFTLSGVITEIRCADHHDVVGIFFSRHSLGEQVVDGQVASD